MSKFQVGDDLVIDTRHRLVQKNANEITLPELSYRLLLILVENAPNIVSHDELVAAVWQERVVSDENLKKRISRLRQALSDNADSPSYIIAERGMGYRCIAPVVVIAESNIKDAAISQTTEAVTSSKHLFKPITLVSVIGIVAFVLMVVKVNHAPKVQNAEKVSEFTAKDYVNKATKYYYRFKADDNDTAVTLYKKAIALDPNFGPAYGGLANAYAQGYYQFGKTENWLAQSINFSEQAIELEPKQAWGYKSLGLGFHLAGRYDESLSAYKKASELAPDWAGPVANSALVYLEKGQLISAYQYVLKSVEMDFKDPIPYAFLGFCYRELRMTEHAKKAIDKSLALKPDYLLAQNYFAEFLLFIGDYERAQKILTITIDKAPKNQFSRWVNAQLHLQTGDLILAKKSFELIAEIGGRYKLPAKVNIAVLNEDALQLSQLKQELDSKIIDGNQWAELIYSKGLIQLAQNNITDAIKTFEQSIKAGMNHSYRFKKHPLMVSISDNLEFKKLLTLLESKNKKQRQDVIKLEHHSSALL